MKKWMARILVICLTVGVISLDGIGNVVKAAEVVDYTLGTTVNEEPGNTDYKYAFSLTSRTKVQLSAKVLKEEGTNANAYTTFKFVRQNSLDELSYDYDESHKLLTDASEQIEVTLQPGDYYLTATRSSMSMYACGYTFCLSVVEEVPTPEGIPNAVAGIGQYEVQYQLGTTFIAHNYQINKQKVKYFFTVPYRMQLSLNVTIDKNEYYNYSTSSYYYDTFYLTKGDSSVKESLLLVDHGETNSCTFTVDKGEYCITQELDTPRSDFSVCISQGDLQANRITVTSAMTIQPESWDLIHPKTYPEDGTAKIRYVSSNPKIATVTQTGKVSALKEGVANVTVELLDNETDAVISKAVCKVTVKEVDQIAKVRSQVGSYAFHNKIWVDFEHASTNDKWLTSHENRTYRIYRSTSKNGKYTLVHTMTSKQSWIHNFEDKKVKPNKQYFYKVSMKIEGRKDFGPLSEAVSYWTAPKPKVKKKSDNGKTITWKKVKGVSGYLVKEHYVHFNGYNIFFKPIYAIGDDYKTVKKLSYKRKHYNYYESGKKTKTKVTLKTYAKHGKYLYVSGYPVGTKKTFNGSGIDLDEW